MTTQNNIPRHIGFIVDGNGRWAQKRNLKRSDGHKAGVEAVKKVVKRCFERGVEVVSLYCFSTENFNRPKEEVDYLFKLFREMKDYGKTLASDQIGFRVMGDKSLLPADVVEILEQIEKETAVFKDKIVNFGVGYGSRREIVQAVNKLVSDGKQVDEESFKDYLYTAGLPDPDLIVRSSGEQRLSNFMLYQAAYAEFYFPKTFFPDFTPAMVDKCIAVYQKRKRRFGKV